MPLWPDGSPWMPHQPSTTINNGQRPTQIPLTGEVYLDAEACQKRCAEYASAIWTCSMTRRSNMTFMEALASERQAFQQQQQSIFQATLQQQAMMMQQQWMQYQTQAQQAAQAAQGTNQPYHLPQQPQLSVPIASPQPSPPESSTTDANEGERLATTAGPSQLKQETSNAASAPPHEPRQRHYTVDCSEPHFEFILKQIHFSQQSVGALVSQICQRAKEVYLPGEPNLFIVQGKNKLRPVELLEVLPTEEPRVYQYKCRLKDGKARSGNPNGEQSTTAEGNADPKANVVIVSTGQMKRKTVPLSRTQVRAVVRESSERVRISDGPLIVYPELVDHYKLNDIPNPRVAQLIHYSELRRCRRAHGARSTPQEMMPKDGEAGAATAAAQAYAGLKAVMRAEEYSVKFVLPVAKAKRKKSDDGTRAPVVEAKRGKGEDGEGEGASSPSIERPATSRPPSVFLDADLTPEDRANEAEHPEDVDEWELELIHIAPALSTYSFLISLSAELHLTPFTWSAYCTALLETKTSNLLFHVLRSLLVALNPDKTIGTDNNASSRKVLFKLLKSYIISLVTPGSIPADDWEALVAACEPGVALPDITQRLLVLEWLVSMATENVQLRKSLLQINTAAPVPARANLKRSPEALPVPEEPSKIEDYTINRARELALGVDRDGRLYFYLTCLPDRVLVLTIENGIELWGYYNEVDQLKQLYGWLNDKGTSERQLRHSLASFAPYICKGMSQAQLEREREAEALAANHGRRTRATAGEVPGDTYTNHLA
eukprot:TRINITY_DN10394_c0_g1_i1.p1 TRINITY_DN10394_c0_g1~~TRINITY_DN10394_c0_g1_i1.p1  ORF type:complete len:773 (+),score=158.57 TRINITY_DN10394_c0_g1_i1:79-2397(+)